MLLKINHNEVVVALLFGFYFVSANVPHTFYELCEMLQCNRLLLCDAHFLIIFFELSLESQDFILLCLLFCVSSNISTSNISTSKNCFSPENHFKKSFRFKVFFLSSFSRWIFFGWQKVSTTLSKRKSCFVIINI